jgi:hypothetical protein
MLFKPLGGSVPRCLTIIDVCRIHLPGCEALRLHAGDLRNDHPPARILAAHDLPDQFGISMFRRGLWFSLAVTNLGDLANWRTARRTRQGGEGTACARNCRREGMDSTRGWAFGAGN